MSSYVVVGREVEGASDPQPVGVACLNKDECRLLTGVMGAKSGLAFRGIEKMDYITLKEFGVTEWTGRQIIGSDPEPEVVYND
jgi:hypothetical protein